MPQIPFHLRYKLSRWQRLIPHFGVWGPTSLMIPVAFAGLVLLAASRSVWWAFAILPLLYVFRGYFIGLLDVILCRVRDMDIIVEKDAMGFLAGGRRWYLFLDGIIDISKYRKDVWTVRHCNGSVVNLLASAITDDQLDHLRAAAEYGRSPEGIQAVVARGRVLQQLESGNFHKDSAGEDDG